MMKISRLLCLVALVSFGFSAMGCHTTEGFGRDLEKGGRKLSNEAREHGG